MAFIELKEGIILNMDIINIIKPANPAPEPGEQKTWSVITNGSPVQISNNEYDTIKSYLRQHGLY